MNPLFSFPGGASVGDAAKPGLSPPITPNGELESLIARSSVFCYSVDYRTGRFRYVSPGVERLLGYDRDDWRFAGPQRAFDLVHPEDQKCLRKIYREIERELESRPVSQLKDLSFSFTCRLRDAFGSYRHLNHHLTFPQLSATGRPLSEFTVVSDISGLKSTETCILRIRYAPGGTDADQRRIVFPCKPAVKFSRREREVLQLIVEGRNSKEIAAALHISYNTVCTHRKNLLRKAGVRGSVELVGMVVG